MMKENVKDQSMLAQKYVFKKVFTPIAFTSIFAKVDTSQQIFLGNVS